MGLAREGKAHSSAILSKERVEEAGSLLAFRTIPQTSSLQCHFPICFVFQEVTERDGFSSGPEGRQLENETGLRSSSGKGTCIYRASAG